MMHYMLYYLVMQGKVLATWVNGGKLHAFSVCTYLEVNFQLRAFIASLPGVF